MTQDATITVIGLVCNASLLIWLINMIIKKPTATNVEQMIDNKINLLSKDILIIKTFMMDIYTILKKDIPSYLKE
jgi:hypothetical protein